MNYLDSDTAVLMQNTRVTVSSRETYPTIMSGEKQKIQWPFWGPVILFLKNWMLNPNDQRDSVRFRFWKVIRYEWEPSSQTERSPKGTHPWLLPLWRMIQCEELPTTNRKASHHQTLHRPWFLTSQPPNLWYSVLRDLTHWADQVKLALLAGQEQT